MGTARLLCVLAASIGLMVVMGLGSLLLMLAWMEPIMVRESGRSFGMAFRAHPWSFIEIFAGYLGCFVALGALSGFFGSHIAVRRLRQHFAMSRVMRIIAVGAGPE